MKRLQKIILWVIIFSLPTQLGIHFWPNFSYVSGFPIDYLSPTLYSIDILIFIFTITHFSGLIKTLKKTNRHLLVSTILLLVLNIGLANQPLLTSLAWLKILNYICFFIVLYSLSNLKNLIRIPLLISTLVVVFLQFAQLLLQRSINGSFYYLGERFFTPYTPGIAKLNLPYLGNFIRPYSTFSHPNSLAGYLLLLFILSKVLFQGKLRKYLQIVLSFSIILTFSKMAIFTLVLLLLVPKIPKTIKKIVPLAFILSFSPLLVNLFNLKYIPHHPFWSRAFMGYSALKVILQNLFTGTGLKGYIPALTQHLNPAHLSQSSLQPVHSLPLLIIAELGLVGVLFIIFLIRTTSLKKCFSPNYSPNHSSNLILTQVFLVLVLTGTVDHYWWTLTQNQLILILALVLGLQTQRLNIKTKDNKK
jgi:hypothetical protein